MLTSRNARRSPELSNHGDIFTRLPRRSPRLTPRNDNDKKLCAAPYETLPSRTGRSSHRNLDKTLFVFAPQIADEFFQSGQGYGKGNSGFGKRDDSFVFRFRDLIFC